MAYLCAGDPTLEHSIEALRTAAAAGADILEIGWPFSDPVADGPVIQAASQRALGHTGRAEVIEAVRRVRAVTDAPIALLGYCNPLLRQGLEATVGELARAGVDALVVADLAFEESAPWRAACGAHGVSLVPFVAPTTRPERLQAIAAAADSFVYAVALLGVTGQRVEQSESILPVVAELRRHTRAPVLAGFGIGDGAQAALWRQRGLDGVIVGSALVQALAEGGQAAVGAKVREIRSGLDNLG
jgi:tryptophan synthase alpha chain